MGRLVTDGAELQSLQVGVQLSDIANNGQVTISTSTKRSGAASYKIVSGSDSNYLEYQPLATDGVLFCRAYYYFTTFPPSGEEPILTMRNIGGAGSVVAISVTSTGTLKLYAENTGTQKGSASSALSLNTWYRIELKAQESGTPEVEGLIDGVSFASGSSTYTVAAGAVDLGLTDNNSNGTTFYVDDIAINDNSGSYQNTYPGSGKVVVAVPTGAGDNAGEVGTYSSINEIPISDTVSSSANRVELQTNTSIADFNMTNSSDLGITSVDDITLVDVYARVAEASSGTSNYTTRIKSGIGGTVLASASSDAGNTTVRTNPNGTTSFTNRNVAYVDPSTGIAWQATGINSIDAMQVGVATTDGNPDIWIAGLYAMVEYNQVTAAFDPSAPVRRIAHSFLASWKARSILGNRTFTIGVSTIGGNDAIGANPGAIGSPGNYSYYDESPYVMGMSWEEGLSQPIGGINKSLAEVQLDNTSGRFLPDFMGGDSELYTAVFQPRKPIIIGAGFEDGDMVTQFSGITNKAAIVDKRNATVGIQAADYIDFFQNKNIDRTAMYTAQRTDQVIETLLGQLGMSTAQYDLDIGYNTIGFGMYNSGDKFANVINDLVAAENGQAYQDPEGIFKFENRLHWSTSPFDEVQYSIDDSQVLNAQAPSEDHIINVVEVNYNPRKKTSSTTIFTQSGVITLPTGNTEVFVQFDNPVLSASAPVYAANSASDGSGSNVTSSVTVHSTSLFAQSCKYVFSNSSGSTAYITSMTIQGRWAILRYNSPQYTRHQDDSSVTAYQEHTQTITNDYIQDSTWADSFSQLLLNDFAEPEKLQVITIRAIPELTRGALVSYNSYTWRVYKVRSTHDPSNGYIQELTMMQRGLASGTSTVYFTIGVSTVGSTDEIAP